MSMKNFVRIVLKFSSVLIVWAASMNGQIANDRTSSAPTSKCRPNPDARYSRRSVLEQLARTLNGSVYPTIEIRVNEEIAEGFFVYDLLDTSNNTLDRPCVDLLDEHVYHFAATLIPDSLSHIAVLRDGKANIFGPVNCGEGGDALQRAVAFFEEHIRGEPTSIDAITRLRNYRQYGWYWTIDQFNPACKRDRVPPLNPDPTLKRREVLLKLRDALASVAPDIGKRRSPSIAVEGDQAIGFFVWDLTEPSNRQTSLTEYVDFKDGHVYHLACIDLPYSFSSIAVLNKGRIKLFKAINCEGKGNTVNDVFRYLKRFAKGNGKSELVGRLKRYRQYGVYAEFGGKSAPQCKEIRSRDR